MKHERRAAIDAAVNNSQRITKTMGFTLVELLVVVAIIALLVSILMPSLQKAREEARIAVCLSNLHGLSVAFGQYTAENNQWWPAACACGGIIYGDGDGPEYAWDTIIRPYYEDIDMIHCPSDTIPREEYYQSAPVPEEKRYPRSYAMNGDVSSFGPSVYCAERNYEGHIPPYPWPAHVHKTTEVTNPSETLLLCEAWDSDYSLWYGSHYYHYSPNIYGDYQGSWVGRYRGEGNICPGRMPTYYHRDNNYADFLFCDGHATTLSKNHPNLSQENDYYYFYRIKP